VNPERVCVMHDQHLSESITISQSNRKKITIAKLYRLTIKQIFFHHPEKKKGDNFTWR